MDMQCVGLQVLQVTRPGLAAPRRKMKLELLYCEHGHLCTLSHSTVTVSPLINYQITIIICIPVVRRFQC